MLKAVRHQLVQNTLPGVTEGGVAQVVAEGHGFGQVLVEPQGTGDGSGDAHDLQGVGHSGTVVVALGLEEDLSLVLQAAKGLGVDNAVHVPLEAGADVAGGDVSLPAAALGGKGGVGCKKCRLPLFGLFPDGHKLPLLCRFLLFFKLYAAEEEKPFFSHKNL